MEVCNLDKLPADCVGEYGKGTVTQMLGRATGSERLYVNIDVLPPGTHSAKYHSHTLQEEFFLVLEGEGELRLEDRTIQVGPGDFFSKTPGIEHAHQFFNSGMSPMRIMDIGTVDRGDVCYYPDEDVCLVKDIGKAFSSATALDGWSSDPDA